jgi:hypothetical protein
MQRFLFHITPFLAILIAVVLFRMWLLKDDRYDFYYRKDLEIQNQVVIIGDSKMLTGIQDEVFNKSNIEIVNLSSWGAFPWDHLIALKPFKLEKNIILLNISSRIFLLNDSSTFENSPVAIKNIFNFRIHKKISDLLNQSAGRWEYSRLPSGSMKFIHQFNTKFDYNWEYDSIYHVKLLNNPLLKSKTDLKIQHLKELVTQLKRDNTVILIDGPERFRFNKLISNYEKSLFAQIQNELNQEVFDFGVYNDSLFYDSHHLNEAGAAFFSTNLITLINSQKM